MFEWKDSQTALAVLHEQEEMQLKILFNRSSLYLALANIQWTFSRLRVWFGLVYEVCAYEQMSKILYTHFTIISAPYSESILVCTIVCRLYNHFKSTCLYCSYFTSFSFPFGCLNCRFFPLFCHLLLSFVIHHIECILYTLRHQIHSRCHYRKCCFISKE